jgi:hypothetical protein
VRTREETSIVAYSNACIPMLAYQDSPPVRQYEPNKAIAWGNDDLSTVYRRLVVLDARSDMAVVLGHTRQVSAGVRADQVKV